MNTPARRQRADGYINAVALPLRMTLRVRIVAKKCHSSAMAPLRPMLCFCSLYRN
jgi:hypothetical protein